MEHLTAILAALADRAALPPAGVPHRKARSLPLALYTSPDIHALERERIFAREWVCVGLAAEIPDPGNYVTFSINDQPIFTVRSRDGAIRSFSNVCRHRMMVLLEGRGTCRKVVCPYHAWTYGLDGALIGAPHMDRTTGFDKASFGLPEIRTEIWHGWIYATLDADAQPVAERLQPLAGIVDRFGMAHYVPVAHQDHLWNTNWKLLCENFMESYHLPVAHRGTLGTWLPMEDIGFPDEAHEAFTWQTFPKQEEARYGRAHPDNTALEGHWRYTSVMPTVYPAHMYVLAPDHLWYLSLRPQGVDHVHVRFGVALAPEVHAALDDPDASIGELVQFFDDVNAEDRLVVEGLYRGVQAPLAAAGPMSWLEREIRDFSGYLAQRLSGPPVRQAAARPAE
jgi:choline monooxygenase